KLLPLLEQPIDAAVATAADNETVRAVRARRVRMFCMCESLNGEVNATHWKGARSASACRIFILRLAYNRMYVLLVTMSTPFRSPLHEMVATTPTDFWSDSCAVGDLTYALEHGAVGATSNPTIVASVLKSEFDAWKGRVDRKSVV